jgi:16S rRNA (cytosine967-C5)-methyltransferase
VRTGDGQDPKVFSDRFQRILIDAPCTGLGALRRRPDARWRKRESDLKGLLQLQKNLLTSGAALLDNGGIIGYVTCSPHILESKVQVADFLRKNPDFHILPINPVWIDADYHSAITPEGFLQLMTAKHNTDGMFLALLERKEKK